MFFHRKVVPLPDIFVRNRLIFQSFDSEDCGDKLMDMHISKISTMLYSIMTKSILIAFAYHNP